MTAIETIMAYLYAGYEDVSDGYKRRIEPQIHQEAQDLYRAVAEELAQKLRKSEGFPAQAISVGAKTTYRWHAERTARWLERQVSSGS